MKTLIVYFSAERGTTAAVAREAAEALGADLLEIRPEGVIASSMNPTYNNPFNPEKSW